MNTPHPPSHGHETGDADSFSLASYLTECQQRCQRAMQDRLTALPALPTPLRDAMEYASLLGGKRIRPALAYAAARAIGDHSPARIDDAACALELIHCYSLIHDDLPAMDNDNLRRGRPTVHKAWDEATAILAGDALQALAFRIISTAGPDSPPAEVQLQMCRELAAAAGYEGMVGGQGIDIQAANRALSLLELETMHRLKTGALIRASVSLGALATGNSTRPDREALDTYARNIGLAFQVQDDILDVASDTSILGKQQGADQARNKPTYVTLLGLDGAREKATELLANARDALSGFGARADALHAIAGYIIQRQH